MKFALALHTDDGVTYGVTVPDLPGCFSGGDTLDEAIEMAKEAIDCHYELMVERGVEIPKAKTIAEHIADPDLADAVWAIVEVDVKQYQSKPVRLNISLPEGLVKSIDEYAKAHHLSRSGFPRESGSGGDEGRVKPSDEGGEDKIKSAEAGFLSIPGSLSGLSLRIDKTLACRVVYDREFLIPLIFGHTHRNLRSTSSLKAQYAMRFKFQARHTKHNREISADTAFLDLNPSSTAMALNEGSVLCSA